MLNKEWLFFTSVTEEYRLESVVHSHHVYKSPSPGDQLLLEMEENNSYDRYAMSLKKDDVIVGRIPAV